MKYICSKIILNLLILQSSQCYSMEGEKASSFASSFNNHLQNSVRNFTNNSFISSSRKDYHKIVDEGAEPSLTRMIQSFTTEKKIIQLIQRAYEGEEEARQFLLAKLYQGFLTPWEIKQLNILKLVNIDHIERMNCTEHFALCFYIKNQALNGQWITKLVSEIKIKADQGYAAAQNNLGYMYENGLGIAKDLGKAFEWYQLAAKQGYAAAQYNLGHMYENGFGIPKDLGKAFECYQLAARQGFAATQYKLGYMYENGFGIPKDLGKAFEWYQLAAKQGLAVAQNVLGYMYLKGYGTTKDLGKAFKWLQSAAKQGHGNAQYNLGYMYREGLGVAKDLGKAFELYQLAANEKHAPPKCWLGYMYENGFGIAKDLGKAFELYQLAANQGYTAAQYNLGCLLKGQGNLTQASVWFWKAAVQGSLKSKLALKEILPYQEKIPKICKLPDDVDKETSDLKENLIHLKDHYIYLYGASGGSFKDTLGKNAYVRGMSNNILNLINDYVSLLDTIDKPGVMLSCIKTSQLNIQFSPFLLTLEQGKEPYFTFEKRDLVEKLLSGKELEVSLIKLKESFETTFQLLKGINFEVDSTQLKQELSTILKTLSITKNPQYEIYHQAFSEFLNQDRSKVREHVSSILEEMQTILTGIDTHIQFATVLPDSMKDLVKNSAEYRNYLFTLVLEK